MKIILAPAVSLLNRLTYPQKYVVMGGVTAVAILWILFQLFTSMTADIAHMRAELTGVKTLHKTQTLIRALQIHRGSSNAVLSGNTKMESTRAGRNQEIGDLIGHLDTDLAGSALVRREDWKKLRAVEDHLKLTQGDRRKLTHPSRRPEGALVCDRQRFLLFGFSSFSFLS